MAKQTTRKRPPLPLSFAPPFSFVPIKSEKKKKLHKTGSRQLSATLITIHHTAGESREFAEKVRFFGSAHYGPYTGLHSLQFQETRAPLLRFPVRLLSLRKCLSKQVATDAARVELPQQQLARRCTGGVRSRARARTPAPARGAFLDDQENRLRTGAPAGKHSRGAGRSGEALRRSRG